MLYEGGHKWQNAQILKLGQINLFLQVGKEILFENVKMQ